MVVALGIVIGLLIVWGLFSVPELMIPFIILVIIVGACVGAKKEKEETETEITETEITIIDTPTEDSVSELCIDSILYLLVRQDNQNFMAPKENRYGDNKRCTE